MCLVTLDRGLTLGRTGTGHPAKPLISLYYDRAVSARGGTTWQKAFLYTTESIRNAHGRPHVEMPPVTKFNGKPERRAGPQEESDTCAVFTCCTPPPRTNMAPASPHSGHFRNLPFHRRTTTTTRTTDELASKCRCTDHFNHAQTSVSAHRRVGAPSVRVRLVQT